MILCTETTPDFLESWITSLSAITQNPSEISGATADSMMDVTRVILDGAADVKLPFSALSSILGSVDTGFRFQRYVSVSSHFLIFTSIV